MLIVMETQTGLIELKVSMLKIHILVVVMLRSFCIVFVTNYPSGGLCLGFPLKGEIQERCEAVCLTFTPD